MNYIDIETWNELSHSARSLFSAVRRGAERRGQRFLQMTSRSAALAAKCSEWQVTERVAELERLGLLHLEQYAGRTLYRIGECVTCG